MTALRDLTGWNRAGLARLRYVDGNAPTFLELVRQALAARFEAYADELDIRDGRTVDSIDGRRPGESDQHRLQRIWDQYNGDRRDLGWEIVRVLARSCHVVTEHIDAYANEGLLGTATQWENLRRLVEMLDYHPAPPASASTSLVVVAKDAAAGTLNKGFQVKYAPKGGSLVVFETLEDVDVDAALNELRPAGHDRNPERLRESTLSLEPGIKGLKTGEPVVLEDDRSGQRRAYLIQGIHESDEQTEVTLRPRTLWHHFRAGYTIVHVEPGDRLAPLGPTAAGAQVDRALYLRQRPNDLLPGTIVHITDGEQAYFRTVERVQDRMLWLDRDVGELATPMTKIRRPGVLAVTTLQGGETLKFRAAGDQSGLVGQAVGAVCHYRGRERVVEYKISSAQYMPAELASLLGQNVSAALEKLAPDDVAEALRDELPEDLPAALIDLLPQMAGALTAQAEHAGYTEISATVRENQPCLAGAVGSVLTPPAGEKWNADLYIEKQFQHLPRTLVVEQPKKTGAGDLVVVVRGNQLAWCKLGAVEVDLERGAARLVASDRWQDRGGSDYYLADTVVYGHFKQALRVRGWDTNGTRLRGPRVPVEKVPAAVKAGTKLLVECGGLSGLESFMTTVADVEDRAIVLDATLPEGCTYGNLRLAGNLVPAGHGESKAEKVLGSGSAAQSNQSFTFDVKEVSFVADATHPSGVRADLEVIVAERRWSQIPTLNDSGPADAHYEVRMTEDGFVRVQFGDGTNGRRLPTGTNNIRIRYRKGTGLHGNTNSGALTKPKKPHPLVEAVRQPLPATGGNDVETSDSLRENAPASLLTLGRAVSLSDFGHLAARHSSVWQAGAFSHPSGLGRREPIEVVVVPANGGPLGNLGTTLRDHLLAHAVPGVDVRITGYVATTFDTSVVLDVDVEGYDADAVKLEVERALVDTFTLKRRRLGQDVYLSEVYKVVENVTGVLHSTITVNGDARLRRIPTDKRSVRVLGKYMVLVKGAATAVLTAPVPGVEPMPPLPAPQMAIDRYPTIVIQGVGSQYAARLAEANVNTVGDLATIEPARLSVAISAVRVHEFKAKANLIGESKIAPAVGLLIGDHTLLALVTQSADALAERTGQSTERVRALQRTLRRLQAVLDEEAFATIRLQDLIPG